MRFVVAVVCCIVFVAFVNGFACVHRVDDDNDDDGDNDTWPTSVRVRRSEAVRWYAKQTAVGGRRASAVCAIRCDRRVHDTARTGRRQQRSV